MWQHHVNRRKSERGHEKWTHYESRLIQAPSSKGSKLVWSFWFTSLKALFIATSPRLQELEKLECFSGWAKETKTTLILHLWVSLSMVFMLKANNHYPWIWCQTQSECRGVTFSQWVQNNVNLHLTAPVSSTGNQFGICRVDLLAWLVRLWVSEHPPIFWASGFIGFGGETPQKGLNISFPI